MVNRLRPFYHYLSKKTRLHIYFLTQHNFTLQRCAIRKQTQRTIFKLYIKYILNYYFYSKILSNWEMSTIDKSIIFPSYILILDLTLILKEDVWLKKPEPLKEINYLLIFIIFQNLLLKLLIVYIH